MSGECVHATIVLELPSTTAAARADEAADGGAKQTAQPAADYQAWRAATDLRAPYRLAPELLAGTKPWQPCWDADAGTPLVAFVNARSGGRAGQHLAAVLSQSLGTSQVFDLSEQRPDDVLAQIWRNLEEQQQRQGNPQAALVRQRLRILAAGGDGTVAWILKAIQQLQLQPPPPVAIVPLGTGNDLSQSFGWGAEFKQGSVGGRAQLYQTLKRVADASVADLDCWRLTLTLPDSSYKPGKTIAVSEAPASSGSSGGGVLLQGLFYNYFSIGADAQAAFDFHHLREAHPALASSRAANQLWYSAFSCSSGWFCGAMPPVASRFSGVEVLQAAGGSWEPLVVPHSIKALVLLNLQSYGGGRNIWGGGSSRKGGWRQPRPDDGLIEVVGFTHGLHAMAVMASNAKASHAKRLAQVAGIRLELRDSGAAGSTGRVHMQLDGEPWLQQVPGCGDGSRMLLEVLHGGTSKVLTNHTPPPAAAQEERIAGAGSCSSTPCAAEQAAAAAAVAAGKPRTHAAL